VSDYISTQIKVVYVTYLLPSSVNFFDLQVVPHKKVRMVKFIDAIPRARNGSILRRELVATFADEDDDDDDDE
jgi:acyl-coenzyme A synthetase/AMP-(fatty) acid ligase